MSRSGGYSSSSSSRGRGQQSWRKITSDSSPDSQTPVRADASSIRRISAGSLDRKQHNSWQIKGHNSDGAVSRNHGNVTPVVCHGQQQGSPLVRGETPLDKEPCSWKLKGNNSDGVVSRNDADVTSSGRRGQQQDSYSFGGERPFRGGKARQWRVPSKASSTADSSQDKQHESSSVEEKEEPCSWKLKGNNSYGVVSRNDADVTSSGRRGQQQDSSSFGGDRSFRGGKARQRRVPFKASCTADSSQDKQHESSAVEEKVPVMQNAHHLADLSRLSLESVMEISHSRSGDEALKSDENARDHKDNEHFDPPSPAEAFDICPPKSSSLITLKPSLLAKNREKRNEMKNSIGGPKGIILRPGMVLLKSYLSSSEQADILRICRTHGLGSAGFYQPLFREGGKLHLKMMCFGDFWDPETSKYGEFRPMDHAKPPSVPPEFLLLVDKAMKFSHSLIVEHYKVKNAEDVLPPVNPDICLVNYYATTGRLGLHQDKDESRESLGEGIPIVSFSIGDSAEFLYGDQRDVEQADKVILDSGDVLIFGGKARHIFHGVSAILPDTAPKSLREGTNFRPGRLNLTFRQHR